MEKQLLLVRHGNTLSNEREIFDGVSINAGLTQKGRIQAYKLGVKLSIQPLDAIYSSSFTRAFQTAKAIAREQATSVPVFQLSQLREINFGIAEGKTFEELRRMGLSNRQLHSFIWATKDNWTNKFPGKSSESKAEAFKRIMKGIKVILASPYERVAVVMHAGVMNALALGLDLQGISYHNCAVNRIYYDTETGRFSQ